MKKSAIAILLLPLMILTACQSGQAVLSPTVEPVSIATPRPTATSFESNTAVQPSVLSSHEASEAPTLTPTKNMPTSTTMPVVTETPTPQPTETAVPTAELQEGEVNYTFTDEATQEQISVALPEAWVLVINDAVTEPQKYIEYEDAKLARIRIEDPEDGPRVLKLGNIVIASETEDGTWEKEDTVYTIPGYLGFEGTVLAQDEDLGAIDDPESVAPTQAMRRIDRENRTTDEMGTYLIHELTPLTPVEAQRKHIVVHDAGSVYETAQMDVTYIYRISDGTTNTFVASFNYDIWDTDRMVHLPEWDPRLGVEQSYLGGITSPDDSLLPSSVREDKFRRPSMSSWLLEGSAHLLGGGDLDEMIAQGYIGLPYASVGSIGWSPSR